MNKSIGMFDGPMAFAVAKMMARGNRDAEAEAVAELDPAPDASILAVGFGPGVGIELLVERLPQGKIGGIDPSRTMIREAIRRNRAAIDAGLIRLERATADAIPWPDASFDGAVAVNSIQLWTPFEESIAEVARVLRPGGCLVSFTHDWAIRMSTGRDVDDWIAWATEVCASHGYQEAASWRGVAEGGRSVAFVARRRE